MDFTGYFLPALILFPILINRLAKYFPRLLLSPVLLLSPIIFIYLTGWSFYLHGPIEITLYQFSTFFSLGLRLGVLSGLIAITVSTIGAIVVRYSVRYLEDDPKRIQFQKNLAYTLSFVLFMLMSPNLLLFFAAWTGTSYFLHQLLTHFSQREGAIQAARQKFWVSRLGDVFILSSGAVLFFIFKSLEFQTLFEAIKNPNILAENAFLINLASLLLVFGAMTKSAQFPFHYWLPKTMETPTPVSAIMHAGIINAGGYLVIRMSPLLATTPIALSVLALVGGFTAFFGTLVMFAQTNVKKSLAYSTIAQMGFMMLQCGLGAFSIATVHIIGHAFYKAYAFLSSGTATDFGKLNRYFPKPKSPSPFGFVLILGLSSMAFVWGALQYLPPTLLNESGAAILLLVLALAGSQIIINSKRVIDGIAMVVLIASLYMALSSAVNFLLGGSIATQVPGEGFLRNASFAICACLFVGLYFIQNSLDKISATEIGRRIYVRALKGGF